MSRLKELQNKIEENVACKNAKKDKKKKVNKIKSNQMQIKSIVLSRN